MKLFQSKLQDLKLAMLAMDTAFLAPEAFTIKHADDYLGELEKRFVVADINQREQKTLETAQITAQGTGLALQASDALIHDISHIVEYPVGILGTFDQSYLELPEEVLTTTMIHHQRFFPTQRQKWQTFRTFCRHFQ